MEADSTTFDANAKLGDIVYLPFVTNPGNKKIYTGFMSNDTHKNLESHLVDKLQTFGLLPKAVRCPTCNPGCEVICKSARVIDRMQWSCEGCGKRFPIRHGSFFLRLQCSLLQAMQMILAWCEDIDCALAAENFGVKPKVATLIYDKLDDLAVKEHNKSKLGGENSIVLAEMYPDCLNQHSPDTTDQLHVHRILMLADTKHIPTFYKLHVIKDDLKNRLVSDPFGQSLRQEIEEVVSRETEPESVLVTSSNIPYIEGAATTQQLAQHCDVEMQHFLSSRVWRQALTLCSASRDLCTAPAPAVCATSVQRYLDTALYRLRYGDGFYEHFLRIIAEEYTEKFSESCNS